MLSSKYRVGIVVDPEYGERLRALAARIHVWVADTDANRAIAVQLWAEMPYSLERGVTTFQVDATSSPPAWAAAILDDIDDHHGGLLHTPPMDAVEIHGATLTTELREALAAYGFNHVAQLGHVLLASVAPAE